MKIIFYRTDMGIFKIAEDGIGITELEIVDEKLTQGVDTAETPLLK